MGKEIEIYAIFCVFFAVVKQNVILKVKLQRNRFFAKNSDFLIHITMQPSGK